MSTFRFGIFEANPNSRELLRNGLRVRISDKPFEMLLLLLERSGQTVTREELRARLWPENVFVDFDANLYVTLNKLRTALGDSAAHPRCIETVPRRGYRLLIPVETYTPGTAVTPSPPGEGHVPAPDPADLLSAWPAGQSLPGRRVWLSAAVVVLLALVLLGSPFHPVIRSGTVNADAREDYLQGRYLWNQRTSEGLRKSLEYFSRAVEKDPGYAEARQGLADSHFLLAANGMVEQSDGYQKAWHEAELALQLDPTLSGAHAVRAMISWQYYRDPQLAESGFRQALALNPRHPSALHWYGLFLSANGRHDEAIQNIMLARAVVPFSFVIRVGEGQILSQAGQHDRAIRALHRAMDMEPDMPASRATLFLAYLNKHLEGGLSPADTQQLRDVLAGYEEARPFWQAVFDGRRDEALRLLEQAAAQGLVSPEYGAAYAYAANFSMLGQEERALALLAQSVERFEQYATRAGVDPRFASLRSDPRFQAILRKAGISFPGARPQEEPKQAGWQSAAADVAANDQISTDSTASGGIPPAPQRRGK